MGDKIILEKVQQQATQYVLGNYIYDASVTLILQELKWESLESHRQ